MKTTSHPQSATSLPRAPRDEVGTRSHRYLLLMGIRVLCFILMVFVQPFGWYTWVFGAGAIFLPYIAVVLANVGQDAKTAVAETPERALDATAHADSEHAPTVITVRETREIGGEPEAAATPEGTQPTAEHHTPGDAS